MTEVSYRAAVVVDGAPEVELVRSTLASLAAQGRPWLSVDVVAPAELEPELRRIRPPSGLGVGIVRSVSAGSGHLCLLRAGGRLLDGALDRIDRELQADPTIDLLYADDALTGTGSGAMTVVSDPILRPGFSPDRLLTQMYLGELVVLSPHLVDNVASHELWPMIEGRWSSPLPHPVAVLAAEQARVIVHVPQVLYLRSGAVAAPTDGAEAVRDLEALRAVAAGSGPDAALEIDRRAPGVLRLRPPSTTRSTVSIIIPTIGVGRTIDGRPTRLVDQTLSSLARLTEHPVEEIVVVLGRDRPSELAADLERRFSSLPLRLIEDDRRFNFSHACNLGAVAARGRELVFLNDDVRITDPRWLARLVMFSVLPDVGAVGARLVYGDGTIQHAGIWSRGGHPVHRYEEYDADEPGYNQALQVVQNTLATTGACLCVSAAKFAHVGGFSPVFPSSYNDVDLCLKLWSVGWRTVVVPETAMIHFEASSRDPVISTTEMELLHRRWRHLLTNDPFDNPNHRAPLSEELPAPWTMAVSGVEHRARRWPSTRWAQDDDIDLDDPVTATADAGSWSVAAGASREGDDSPC